LFFIFLGKMNTIFRLFKNMMISAFKDIFLSKSIEFL